MILRTSEWVSPGHPDKVADGISEHILDKLLAVDPDTRFALEVQIKGNSVSLAGEITTKANVVEGDYQHWAKAAVNAIGYTKEYQHKWGVENTICGDDLVVLCKEILVDEPLFFIINSYTTGLSKEVFTNILKIVFKNNKGKKYSEEIGIPIKNSDLVLPCGMYKVFKLLLTGVGIFDLGKEIVMQDGNVYQIRDHIMINRHGSLEAPVHIFYDHTIRCFRH